jgi:hypothetical protein
MRIRGLWGVLAWSICGIRRLMQEINDCCF